MHLMIFYPGGVDRGVPNDISDDNEIYNMLYNAATIEQGNGKAVKEKRRELGTHKSKSKSGRL